MVLPWIRILDLVVTMADFARTAKTRSIRAAVSDPDSGIVAVARRREATEAKLATVVVAALKEAFRRDHQRLAFEREQVEAEHRRAERLLKMELARQAGDREIDRLRLLAGVAFVSLLATLVVAAVAGPGGVGARIALGVAWLCLLGAMAAAFSGQSRVSSTLASFSETHGEPRIPTSEGAGPATVWLILLGVAVTALSVLLR